VVSCARSHFAVASTSLTSDKIGLGRRVHLCWCPLLSPSPKFGGDACGEKASGRKATSEQGITERAKSYQTKK